MKIVKSFAEYCFLFPIQRNRDNEKIKGTYEECNSNS